VKGGRGAACCLGLVETYSVNADFVDAVAKVKTSNQGALPGLVSD
jgi:hypothetical protein